MAEREKARSDRAFAEQLVANRFEAAEVVAAMWAEYEEAYASQLASDLRRKTRPAPRAADAVRDAGGRASAFRRQARLAEWLVALYEWHVPWLTELRDLESERSYVDEEPNPHEQDDPSARYLSVEEYRALAPAARNQRALDRYLRSHMTAWQLGRDYERYIGYLREQDGSRVTYHGIFKGLEDLGRDLIDREKVTCLK